MLENMKLVLRTLKRFPGDSKEKSSMTTGSKPDITIEQKKGGVPQKRVVNQEQTQQTQQKNNVKQLNNNNPRNLKTNVQPEQTNKNNSRPNPGRNPQKK